MSNEVVILEELLKSEKKSEASKEKKHAFYNNWLELAKNEGFNSIVEIYFYKGFAFCGAEPLKQYISESPEPNKALEEFFHGNKYSENNSDTFRIITHLLALFLNSGDKPEIVSRLIEKFLITYKNKENKILGTANTTLEKYFLKVLNPDSNLIPLSELQMSTSTIENFVKVMTELTSDISSPNVSKANVMAWLNSYSGENTQEITETPKTEGTTENPASTLSASAMLSQVLEKVVEMEKQNEQYKNENTKLQQLLMEERAKLQDSQPKVEELEKQNEQYQSEIFNLNQLLSEGRIKLQNSLQKIDELEKNLNSLQDELSQKNGIINNQKDEIEDHIQTIEILNNEQERKAEVALNKISSKLKIEYQDFQTALNIPITDDLGENFRQQLKNIFKELERNGVKFN